MGQALALLGTSLVAAPGRLSRGGYAFVDLSKGRRKRKDSSMNYCGEETAWH
jgi:hypothetical protein